MSEGVTGLYITTATKAVRFIPGMTLEDAIEAMLRGFVSYKAILISTHGAILEIVTIPASSAAVLTPGARVGVEFGDQLARGQFSTS